MRFGLSEDVIGKICGVLARHPQVARALIYGSRALGTQQNGSDIDLTLAGEGLDLDVLLQIRSEIDDLLLPYTVDLSLLDDIGDPGLREHIERVGRVFYSRQPR